MVNYWSFLSCNLPEEFHPINPVVFFERINPVVVITN